MITRKQIWIWGALAAVASLVPFFGFQFDPSNRLLLEPLGSVSPDSLYGFIIVKGVLEGTVVPFFKMNLPQMAAPFGPLNILEGFPITEQFQLALIRLIGFFDKDPIRVQNIFYLFGYILTSIAFFGSAVWLKIRPALAFGLSLAFTYLNFHLIRYHHLALSQYWVLAPAAALVVKVLDRSLLETRRTHTIAFFTAFGIGLWHSYYGYFFTGMYCVGWICVRFRRPFKPHFSALAAPILGFLFAIGLSTGAHVFAHTNSMDQPGIFKRAYQDTRLYCLQLRSVVLPPRNHRLSSVADLLNPPIEKWRWVEGMDESIGLVGLSGLVLGLGAIYRRLKKKKTTQLFAFGIAQVLILFFASGFGFSMWVAILISPTFRAVNRISPMLAATCLFAVGVFLTNYLSKYDRRPFAKLLSPALGVLLGVFAVWDQVPPFRPGPKEKLQLESARSFASRIESVVGEGPVLQIPSQSFPESQPVFDMEDYSHSLAPLFTHQTKWSYGTFKNTKRDLTIRSAADHPTNLALVRELGYRGIWIDRAGFPDRGTLIEEKLSTLLGRAAIVSSDGRRSFFLLETD